MTAGRCGKNRGNQGAATHYDTLRVSRQASDDEIRKAFRRGALETHPDKLAARLGRAPTQREISEASEAYCKLVVAFDVLSDGLLRLQYDREHAGEAAAGGEEAGGGASAAATEAAAAAAPAPPPQEAAAQAKPTARLIIQGVLSADTAVDVSNQSLAVLVALRHLLDGTREVKYDMAADSYAAKLDPCLFPRRNGYEVEVAFSDNFFAGTRATRCLEEAVGYRIALTSMRSRAAARLAKATQPGNQDPVTEEEVKQALTSDPSMRLMFRFRKKELSSPMTENLPLVLFLRQLLRSVESQAGKKREAAIERLRKRANEDIKQDKQRVQKALPALLSATQRALESRALTLDRQVNTLDRQLRERAPALHLQNALGFTGPLGDTAVIGAVLTLRQLSSAELARRRHRLLAPPATRSLPAAPHQQPQQPRHEQRRGRSCGAQRSHSAPELAAAAAPPPSRPQRPPEPPWRPVLCARGRPRSWIGRWPDEVALMPLRWLSCVDLDAFQAANASALVAGDREYWDRCRVFAPEQHVIGGGKFSRRGRALLLRGERSAAARMIRFLARRRLASAFEAIDLTAVPVSWLERDEFFAALRRMPHLERLRLPARGWSHVKAQRHFADALQERVEIFFEN